MKKARGSCSTSTWGPASTTTRAFSTALKVITNSIMLTTMVMVTNFMMLAIQLTGEPGTFTQGILVDVNSQSLCSKVLNLFLLHLTSVSSVHYVILYSSIHWSTDQLNEIRIYPFQRATYILAGHIMSLHSSQLDSGWSWRPPWGPPDLGKPSNTTLRILSVKGGVGVPPKGRAQKPRLRKMSVMGGARLYKVTPTAPMGGGTQLLEGAHLTGGNTPFCCESSKCRNSFFWE